MARRFLPVILPGALLFAAAAALSGTRGAWAPTRMLRWHDWRGIRPAARDAVHAGGKALLQHVEYAGVIARLEALSATLGDRDLLVVESRNAGPTRTSSRCRSPTSTRAMCWSSTRRGPTRPRSRGSSTGRAPGTTACCSWAAAEPTCCRRRGPLDAVASERFQIPEYDAPADAYPRFARAEGVRLQPLRIDAAGPIERGAALRSGCGRQRRPARRPVPRQGADRGPLVPLVARDGRSCRSPTSVPTAGRSSSG